MRLFHYSTWRGFKIYKTKTLIPQDTYGWGDPIWPKYIFLTTNEMWEPSVQATSPDGFREKIESCPWVYEELGIPCWKFEIQINNPTWVLTYRSPFHLWACMIADARWLKSKVSEWYITDQECKITEAWKWRIDQWDRPYPEPKPFPTPPPFDPRKIR